MAIKISEVRIVDEEQTKLIKRLSKEFRKQVEDFQNGDWNIQKLKNANGNQGQSRSYFFEFPKNEKQPRDRQGVHGFIKSVGFGVGIFLVDRSDINKKEFYKSSEKQQKHYTELLRLERPECSEVLIITNFNAMIDRIAKILTEGTNIKVLDTAKLPDINASDVTEERKKVYYEPPEHTERRARLAKVWDRPNQKNFSNMIRAEYKGTCIITGCTTQAALEAAHIKPVKHKGADTLENGLLLRADLHLLFDAYLMAIDPKTSEVHFKGTDKNYNKYTHAKIPDNDKLRENLKIHWQKFQTT